AAYTGVRQAIRTQSIGQTLGSDGNVAPSSAQTTELYDGFGRLRSVTEKSDGDVTTKYEYDIGDRLKSASTTGSGLTQLREFTYDNAGFLTQEKHPELGGTTGNAIKRYTKIDARGHVRESDMADFSGYMQRFDFDTAERLTKVKDGSNVILKELQYGGSANGNANGRLLKAIRHNKLESGVDMISTQSFTYDGIGRITDRETKVDADSTNIQTFTQSFVWDKLSNPTTNTYPNGT